MLLLLPFSRCKCRVNKRGLMRLRQIQMLKASFAVLVALVAYQRVLLMLRTGRRHQGVTMLLLLILEYSRELGLL